MSNITTFVSIAPLPCPRQNRHKTHTTPVCRARGRGRGRPQQADTPTVHEWTAERLGFTEVGIVLGSHGIRGEVRVRSVGDFGNLRLSGHDGSIQRYLLRQGRKYPRPVSLSKGRPSPRAEEWILRIGAGIQREKVGEYRGAKIFVRDSDMPPVQPDEFTVPQIVGLRVLLADRRIGVVRSVHSGGDVCAAAGAGKAAAKIANDTLEIALVPEHQDEDMFSELNRVEPSDLVDLADSKCVLVPFVKEIVPVVDVDAGFIEIDPPPGLLDIAIVNRKTKAKPPRGLLVAAQEQ